jgi:hypothetical protein
MGLRQRCGVSRHVPAAHTQMLFATRGVESPYCVPRRYGKRCCTDRSEPHHLCRSVLRGLQRVDFLMIAANTIPAQELSTTRTLQPRRRARSDAAGYVATLKTKLGITKDQLEAWAKFAATLSANRRRMQPTDDENEPFGLLQNRLAALRRMRQAAAELLLILEPAQQHKALQMLPLCCLARSVWTAGCLGEPVS